MPFRVDRLSASPVGLEAKGEAGGDTGEQRISFEDASRSPLMAEDGVPGGAGQWIVIIFRIVEPIEMGLV